MQPDLAYLNLGRRGRLAGEVRATQLEPVLDFGPDLASLVAGGNDSLQPSFDMAFGARHRPRPDVMFRP